MAATVASPTLEVGDGSKIFRRAKPERLRQELHQILQRLAGSVGTHTHLFSGKSLSVHPKCWIAEQLRSRGIPARKRDEQNFADV